MEIIKTFFNTEVLQAGGATGRYVASQLSGFRLQLDTVNFGHLIPELTLSMRYRSTELNRHAFCKFLN